MKSLLHTGASLALRVAYEDGTEKMIGFARNFSYTVTQGQKLTYTVDSPLPQEIAQGASPMVVKGSITLYLPKGTTPESVGLVPYRTDAQGRIINVLSKHLHFRIYDRFTQNLVFTAEYCKVANYTVSIQTRGIAEVSLTFDGILSTPGLTL
jgi:hypothetical protein